MSKKQENQKKPTEKQQPINENELKSELNDKLNERTLIKDTSLLSQALMNHLYEIKRAAYNSDSFTKFLLLKNSPESIPKFAKNYMKKSLQSTKLNLFKFPKRVSNRPDISKDNKQFRVVFENSAQNILTKILNKEGNQLKYNDQKIIVPKELYQQCLDLLQNKNMGLKVENVLQQSDLSLKDVEKFTKPLNYLSLKYDILNHKGFALQTAYIEFLQHFGVKIYHIIKNKNKEFSNKDALVYAISQALKSAFIAATLIGIKNWYQKTAQDQKLKLIKNIPFVQKWTIFQNQVIKNTQILLEGAQGIVYLAQDIYQYTNGEITKNQLMRRQIRNIYSVGLNIASLQANGVFGVVLQEFMPILSDFRLLEILQGMVGKGKL